MFETVMPDNLGLTDWLFMYQKWCNLAPYDLTRFYGDRCKLDWVYTLASSCKVPKAFVKIYLFN